MKRTCIDFSILSLTRTISQGTKSVALYQSLPVPIEIRFERLSNVKFSNARGNRKTVKKMGLY